MYLLFQFTFHSSGIPIFFGISIYLGFQFTFFRFTIYILGISIYLSGIPVEFQPLWNFDLHLGFQFTCSIYHFGISIYLFSIYLFWKMYLWDFSIYIFRISIYHVRISIYLFGISIYLLGFHFALNSIYLFGKGKLKFWKR